MAEPTAPVGSPTVVIPALTITTEDSPDADSQVLPPGLQAPPSPSPTSADGLLSPIPDSPANTHTETPPSPLTSFQFPTSLALRHNAPLPQSSLGLLALENPQVPSHRRNGSNTTVATTEEGTEVGHKDVVNAECPKADTVNVVLDTNNINGNEDPIDSSPFLFGPSRLASLIDTKNLGDLTTLGGVQGLLQGLGTRQETGLSHTDTSDLSLPQDAEAVELSATSPFASSLDDRRRVYGTNILPPRSSRSLIQLMWAAMKDKVLIVLSIAACISLTLGLMQDFGIPKKEGEAPLHWVEGIAITAAVAIVILVGSINDWQKERQFQMLDELKSSRGVSIIRAGFERVVDVKDVVVGDIAILEPGEVVPCDGVFLAGHNVKCDESGITGESDVISKASFPVCLSLRETAPANSKGSDLPRVDCFILSGSKVLEGCGRYLVIAVGENSLNGKLVLALRRDREETLLQLKLNALADLIAKIGSAVGLLLFVALLIRFFIDVARHSPVRTPTETGKAFVNILITAVTLIVVAVPEGLPLAVSLALAFATKRMRSNNLLVRVLGSCETMANTSVVCTDKTGILTQNVMTVVAGSVGIHAKFARHLEETAGRADARQDPGIASRKHHADFAVDLGQLNSVLSPEVQTLLNTAIAINSTAFEDVDSEIGEAAFVGSKTEGALLKFAKELGWEGSKALRERIEIVHMIPFSSERKAMGAVIKLDTSKYRLFVTGASEILASRCAKHVVVDNNGTSSSSSNVLESSIDNLKRDNINRTIIFYANQALRTIALCYRDLDSWPPNVPDDEELSFEALTSNMSLLAIMGLEDPLRPSMRDAVSQCHRAGVMVKMCTGDNVLTARAVASQCGIYTPGGIIMEGQVFRTLSDDERLLVVPRLQVLARSTPEDKRLLAQTIQSFGEVIGVTGEGTNDGPVLKSADVGFSMGIAGTEIAKEASDIILMDDNFTSIVKAIIWGRSVNDSIRKFLQFQLATNIAAIIITLVTAVSSEEQTPVLSAVQLLWINIIMDTFAALALATDPPTDALLDRKPDKRTAPLFTVNMYKMILFQSVYQVIITLIFYFLGYHILGFDHSKDNDKLLKTVVFNAFVFAQIFNSLNCRRLDRELNIFKGMFNNWYFLFITFIEIGVQILIIFVCGPFMKVVRLPGREWGITVALGAGSIPVGILCRVMPSNYFERAFRKVGLLGHDVLLPMVNNDFTGSLTRVRDNLATFSNIRGGRVRSSSFIIKTRRAAQLSQAPTLPSTFTMIDPAVGGSAARDEAYNSGSLFDPAQADPSSSTAALWEGKINIHPGTSSKDPVLKLLAGRRNVYTATPPTSQPSLHVSSNSSTTSEDQPAIRTHELKAKHHRDQSA